MKRRFRKIVAVIFFILISLLSLYAIYTGLVLMFWSGGGPVELTMIIGGIAVFILLFVVKYFISKNAK